MFPGVFANENATAAALDGFDVLVPMRERTALTATLLARLPKLRMIALTGGRAPTLAMDAATAQGILVCNTGGVRSSIGTAELTLGLILAAARFIPAGDAAIRDGQLQDSVGVGPVLDGRTLGIVGLGRTSTWLAGYGRALGMHVIAWSPNLTEDAARAGGARLITQAALLAESDVISLTHCAVRPLMPHEREIGVCNDDPGRNPGQYVKPPAGRRGRVARRAARPVHPFGAQRVWFGAATTWLADAPGAQYGQRCW